LPNTLSSQSIVIHIGQLNRHDSSTGLNRILDYFVINFLRSRFQFAQSWKCECDVADDFDHMV